MKKVIIVLIPFILLIVLTACSSDDDNQNFNATDIDLVTGLDLRSTINEPATRVGNPNTFSDMVVVAPNPVLDNLSIGTSSPIIRMWVVPANASMSFKETDFSSLLTESTYSIAEIESRSVGSSEGPDAILLEELSPGYYRLFIETETGLQWENIYKSPEDFEIQDFIDSWE